MDPKELGETLLKDVAMINDGSNDFAFEADNPKFFQGYILWETLILVPFLLK